MSFEESTESEYRPVCVWAIAALFTGVLSATALAHPLMWLIAVLAILLATMAMTLIRRSEGALLGRKAALTGLCLGCLFLSWSVMRYCTDRWLVYQHARTFANNWFEVIRRGDYYQAHQLTLPSTSRLKHLSNLASIYENHPYMKDELDGFFNVPPASTIKGYGKKNRVRFLGNVEQSRLGPERFVAQEFEVSYSDEADPASIKVRLLMVRKEIPELDLTVWHVEELRRLDEETKP